MSRTHHAAAKLTTHTSRWWLCLGLSWLIGVGTAVRIGVSYIYPGQWGGDYSVLYAAAYIVNDGCCESAAAVAEIVTVITNRDFGRAARLSPSYDQTTKNKTLDTLRTRWAHQNFYRMVYTLPPGFTVLIRPLALLDWPASRVAWLVVAVSGVVVALSMAARQGVPWWAVVTALSFVPLLYGFANGNINTLLLAATLTSWAMMWPTSRAPADFWGGIFIGLATSAKLFFGLWLLDAALTRRWKVLAGSLTVAAAILAVGIVGGGGINATAAYVGMLGSYEMDYASPESQSLISVWTRLFQGSRFLLNGEQIAVAPLVNAPGLVWPLSLVSTVILLGLTSRWLEGAARIAGLTVVGVLAFPVAWYHTHMMVLFPWLLASMHAKSSAVTSWLLVASLLVYQVSRFYPYFGHHVFLLNLPVYAALGTWTALVVTFRCAQRSRRAMA